MKEIKQIRTGRHCVFNMHVHLVFVTKYRKKNLQWQCTYNITYIFSDVCSRFNANLIEMDGEKDYVQLLIEYPPKTAVSQLVNSLKGVSSRLYLTPFLLSLIASGRITPARIHKSYKKIMLLKAKLRDV